MPAWFLKGGARQRLRATETLKRFEVPSSSVPPPPVPPASFPLRGGAKQRLAASRSRSPPRRGSDNVESGAGESTKDADVADFREFASELFLKNKFSDFFPQETMTSRWNQRIVVS